jgi:hypothetical protein
VSTTATTWPPQRQHEDNSPAGFVGGASSCHKNVITINDANILSQRVGQQP